MSGFCLKRDKNFHKRGKNMKKVLVLLKVNKFSCDESLFVKAVEYYGKERYCQVLAFIPLLTTNKSNLVT